MASLQNKVIESENRKRTALVKRLVVHCKEDPFDVYIGRPSKYGNMFSHKSGTLAKYKVATVEEAVEKFEEWADANPAFKAMVRRELIGKVLGCWCKSKRTPNAPCHGDILVRIANDQENPDEPEAR